jgi:peptide chain release factor 2
VKKKELSILEERMAGPGFWEDKERSRNAAERVAELKDAAGIWDELALEAREIAELAALPESGEIAAELETRFAELTRRSLRAKREAFLSGKYDKGDAVITIFAGAGGDDAEDWARMLFLMFTRYAARQKWGVEVLHRHENDHGGIRNATIEIDGRYAYGYLRGEMGVHRLVRVSPFSSKSLRHTSFALVEVLPKFVAPDEVELKDEDLETGFARSSGPGGQNVNKRETAVYIKHKPTGMQVHVSTERSQQQNRERALGILRAKLYQRMIKEQTKERESFRATGVEAEWGHQIRSYVLHPYKMVKDHRTDVETAAVEKVLNGELDEFIEAEIEQIKN